MGGAPSSSWRRSGFMRPYARGGLDRRRDGTDALPGASGINSSGTASWSKGPELHHLRFAADVVFPSPTAAAAVVLARNASGPQEWRLRGTGQTYKVWRAAKLAERGERG